jgi:uncharacterized protein (TIGR01619 family)
MTEHWAAYLCNVNDKLASIFLDLELRNTVPDTGRPWLLWVWVYFKQPRPDGLSSTEEFSTLCAIEDELNDAMWRNCQAMLAGRITTQCRREFYYYGPRPDAFQSAVAEALRSFNTYEFDQGTQHDPQWQQYLNVLYPSPDDLQRILNREVLDVMGKEGDQPQTPREVLHWSYFPKEDNRSDFKAAVQAKGYRIDSESHHPESDNPYGICFGKVQKTGAEAIDESVLELAKLSERFQGEYDGWEAQVMSDEVAEKPGAKPN